MFWKTLRVIGGVFETAVGIMVIYQLGVDAGKKAATE